MDGIDFTRGEPGMIENGFNIVYEEFDDIQLKIIKNNNDIRLFNWVTYSFTNDGLTRTTCSRVFRQSTHDESVVQ